MITIVDYGMGNLGSIVNMLRRAGFEARASSEPAEIAAASKLILPGVGAFDSGIQHLDELGLRAVLETRAQAGTPVLGICLGMQLLFEGSEEGQLPGLGWLRGRCVRFRFEAGQERLKVPHMGWNEVAPTRRDSLFATLRDDAGFYFVHSYYAQCADDSDVLARTHHGHSFVSAVQRGNVFGTQFHPEKSHSHGLRLLTCFAEL